MKLPKGWRVTTPRIKLSDGSWMYRGRVWFNGNLISDVPIAYELKQHARDGSIRWLMEQIVANLYRE